VHIALSGYERHGIPRDGRVLGRIEAHRAVERLVVLDIEFELQPGKVGSGKVFAPQVTVIVVSVPPAQDREVVGSLKNARNRYARLGRVVHRGRCATTGEALRLEIPPRVEDIDSFTAHRDRRLNYYRGVVADPDHAATKVTEGIGG
jgi:hypothetical protein